MVFSFVSVYAPQTGLPESAKQSFFYDQLQIIVSNIPASESLILLGDWNGHVGKNSDEYPDVHGGHGCGSCNLDGERILEFAVANELVVGNTLFKKRDTHLVTYCSGPHMTQIDYMLFRKNFRKSVLNVKVIPSEECVQQHKLLVGDFLVKIPC